MQITLPDGSSRSFEQETINGFDIALSISKGLMKAAVAIERVDSEEGTQALLSGGAVKAGAGQGRQCDAKFR